MRIRRVARIVLLDQQGRLLLFRYEDARPIDADGRGPVSYWTIPGGGVEDGETFEAAARRELREETGITTAAIGPCIWRRRKPLRHDGEIQLQDEHYFLATVSAGDFDVRGCPEEECRAFRGCRWWHSAEIESSGDTFFPEGLARLVVPILRGEVPALPIDINEA